MKKLTDPINRELAKASALNRYHLLGNACVLLGCGEVDDTLLAAMIERIEQRELRVRGNRPGSQHMTFADCLLLLKATAEEVVKLIEERGL